MNVIMSSKDKSVHNEIQISMHTCRSLMSDAPQGTFVVMQEISLCDISCIIMTTGSAGGLFGPYKGPLPAVRLKTR